jgi:pyruvate dehydrogenase E2 component (dihydrolipoamide acetyltransferase)
LTFKEKNKHMAQVLNLPRMSDTMEEGVLASLKIKVGDTIKTGDVIADVETDKATMEWESFVAGTVLYVAVKSGDTVPVEGLVAILGKPGEDYAALLAGGAAPTKAAAKTEAAPAAATAAPAAVATAAPSNGSSSGGGGRVKASPLAKTIAKELGVDIHNIAGSGEEGRIVKRDVEAAASAKPAGVKINTTVAGQESFEEFPVSQMRKTIARRLAESKFGAPHFYLTMEFNMDNAMSAREAMNESSPVKISFNDIVIKATALSLKQHPNINSSWLGDKIRVNHHVHIGMAVAVEEGLLVPVIRFADQKSLSQLASESKDYAEKARQKKIQPNDMQGNTFTISNLGMMGIEEFTAIINPPDACILAVGSIKKVPALKNGQWVETNVMKVTLSCDHRVVDGAMGARFLQTMKGFVENPVKMLV